MEREPLAKYVVRETPWLYKIVEIVPDYRGNLYIKTVAVGRKGEMVNAYRELYGEDFIEPKPITGGTNMGKVFGSSAGRRTNNRPYSDLDSEVWP